jgi:hypothetical protein
MICTKHYRRSLASTLEGTHRIEVLLYLLKNGPQTKGELSKELHMNPTVFLGGTLGGLLGAGQLPLDQ